MMWIGIAVSTDGLIASTRERTWRLAASEFGAGLDELRESGPRRAVLHVALLPPLVEVKHLVLPPLRRQELMAVLGRDAERFFVIGGAPLCLAAERIGRLDVIAAAADAAVVERIYAEAERVGWAIGSVVPAHEAWIRSALAHAEVRRGRARVVVVRPHGIELLTIHHSRLTGVRRFGRPLRPSWGVELERAIAADTPVIVIGPHDHAAEVTALLASRSNVVSKPTLLDREPSELAARRAVCRAVLDLVPAVARRATERRVGRVARLMTGVAAGLVAGSMLVEWWGTARELARVTAHRQRLAAEVAEAVAVRAALDAWGDRLAAIRGADERRVRWSGVLADVADHLPADAHLTSFRGAADSLIAQGVATQAVASLEALQRSSRLAGLRALAPIRQEVRDTGLPREEFLVGARLRTRTAAEIAR